MADEENISFLMLPFDFFILVLVLREWSMILANLYCRRIGITQFLYRIAQTEGRSTSNSVSHMPASDMKGDE